MQKCTTASSLATTLAGVLVLCSAFQGCINTNRELMQSGDLKYPTNVVAQHPVEAIPDNVITVKGEALHKAVDSQPIAVIAQALSPLPEASAELISSEKNADADLALAAARKAQNLKKFNDLVLQSTSSVRPGSAVGNTHGGAMPCSRSGDRPRSAATKRGRRASSIGGLLERAKFKQKVLAALNDEGDESEEEDSLCIGNLFGEEDEDDPKPATSPALPGSPKGINELLEDCFLNSDDSNHGGGQPEPAPAPVAVPILPSFEGTPAPVVQTPAAAAPAMPPMVEPTSDPAPASPAATNVPTPPSGEGNPAPVVQTPAAAAPAMPPMVEPANDLAAAAPAATNVPTSPSGEGTPAPAVAPASPAAPAAEPASTETEPKKVAQRRPPVRRRDSVRSQGKNDAASQRRKSAGEIRCDNVHNRNFIQIEECKVNVQIYDANGRVVRGQLRSGQEYSLKFSTTQGGLSYTIALLSSQGITITSANSITLEKERNEGGTVSQSISFSVQKRGKSAIVFTIDPVSQSGYSNRHASSKPTRCTMTIAVQ